MVECYRHEGTNYVTRPWVSDKRNTRQFTNYVTRPWASEEGDHRTYEEEQPQTSISHHSPQGECQYSNIKGRQGIASLAHVRVI